MLLKRLMQSLHTDLQKLHEIKTEKNVPDIPVFDKLSNEIMDERKNRHDLIMKKFAFLTTFVGAGALEIAVKNGAG